jgi:protein-tyrosine phosphatase
MRPPPPCGPESKLYDLPFKPPGQAGFFLLWAPIFVINSVLVVCTGNICRSPIGEGLLALRAPGIKVASAGVGAMVGWPADELAVEVMKDRGHDIATHRARQLTRALLAETDLVLTLDQHHSDWINGRFPEYRGKVHKILRWQNNADVPDPYRQPKAAFEHSYQLIDRGLGEWLKRF